MNTTENLGITLRKASYHDIDFIAHCQLAMALETENLSLNYETVQQGALHVIQNSSIGHYLIPMIENKPAGCMLVLFEWSDWRNAEVLWIHSLYILPYRRSKGVFKTMFEHLKDKVLLEEGFRGIRLFVDKSNTKAREVYQQLGMNGHHYELFEWMP